MSRLVWGQIRSLCFSVLSSSILTLLTTWLDIILEFFASSISSTSATILRKCSSYYFFTVWSSIQSGACCSLLRKTWVFFMSRKIISSSYCVDIRRWERGGFINCSLPFPISFFLPYDSSAMSRFLSLPFVDDKRVELHRPFFCLLDDIGLPLRSSVSRWFRFCIVWILLPKPTLSEII